MDKPLLSDAAQYPDDDIIFSHIGKAKPLWIALFDWIRTEQPALEKEWRFYKDGYAWLMKITCKKKTIFWLSIVKDSFRTTCYLTDKAEAAIMASNLPDELKQQFRENKKHGKIRGLTILYTSDKDLAAARELIGIKMRLK
jgi:hypothetical protein